MFNTNIKQMKKKIITFNNKELKHSDKIVVLGMIYNDKNNYLRNKVKEIFS